MFEYLYYQITANPFALVFEQIAFLSHNRETVIATAKANRNRQLFNCVFLSCRQHAVVDFLFNFSNAPQRRCFLNQHELYNAVQPVRNNIAVFVCGSTASRSVCEYLCLFVVFFCSQIELQRKLVHAL